MPELGDAYGETEYMVKRLVHPHHVRDMATQPGREAFIKEAVKWVAKRMERPWVLDVRAAFITYNLTNGELVLKVVFIDHDGRGLSKTVKHQMRGTLKVAGREAEHIGNEFIAARLFEMMEEINGWCVDFSKSICAGHLTIDRAKLPNCFQPLTLRKHMQQQEEEDCAKEVPFAIPAGV